MRTFIRVFAGIAFAAASLAFAPESRAASPGAMRVVLIQGDVQVKLADTGEWAPASINMPLLEGDELWVPEGGRTELQMNNGAYVRLDRDTALQVLRMDRDAFQFYLPQGGAYVLNPASKRGVLQIDTPEASLRNFGGSTFRVDLPEAQTDVSVFRGSVLAENGAGRTNVRPGQMLALGSDGFADLSPLPPPDEWQRWNEERDRIVLARGPGYRYLPPEMVVYSSDFDANGRWVDVPDYGYCWTPTVFVSADWAPYRHGRWVWRGGDYVWIGYEPWGWAPYHYGRWTFVARIGWCWVPPARGDVYWAPGYVGWVRTGDYVAWVPLAPRETYYGRGNYGRYSRNITNVNVNQIRVTNVYRNVNVTNSVTVVHQTTFLTGRPETVRREVTGNIREDFAQRRNIVIGRPPIKPVEASRVPVIRSIPEAKRPPASVRKMETKQLRESRPLIRESGRSVVRPMAKPAPLQVRKVEKPRAARERVVERKQVLPVAPQGRAPASVERGRTTREAPPPKEQVRPSAPQGRPPAGVEQRRTREAPPQREQVRPTAPQGGPPAGVERGRTRESAPAKEQVRPAAPPQGRPPATVEPRRPREAAPPTEQVRPAAPQGGPPANVERERTREAPPQKENVRPEPQRGKEREEQERPPREPVERGERERR